MTEPRKDKAAEAATPEDLDTEALDHAAGGWGRTMYHSYSSESARFRTEDTSRTDS